MDATAEAIVATVAARIVDLRRARGLSLQDLADRTGLAKSHVWEIERGRSRNPTIATAISIARALGVSLDYLTGLSSDQPLLHPEAIRIACEIDAAIRRARISDERPCAEDRDSGLSPKGASATAQAGMPRSPAPATARQFPSEA